MLNNATFVHQTWLSKLTKGDKRRDNDRAILCPCQIRAKDESILT